MRKSGNDTASLKKNSAMPIKNSRLWKAVWGHRSYYLIILPVLIFFFVFSYVPMYGVLIAFKDFSPRKGILGSPWLEPLFKNFQMAFGSDLFRRSLWNTLVISFLKLVVAFPVPIIFAVMVDELPGTRFKKVLQTVSYLPYFMSWVVLGGILRNILSPSSGALNAIVEFFGGESIHFLGREDLFRWVIFFSYIWQSVGYGAVVYLAAIAGIDQQLMEAARIDGASRLQVIRHITIPSIRSVIVIMFLLSLGDVLSAGFDQIFNLYSPVVYSTGDIIDTYVYRLGLVNFEFSYSTAIGLLKNVVGLILVVVSNLMVRRIDPDSALF